MTGIRRERNETKTWLLSKILKGYQSPVESSDKFELSGKENPTSFSISQNGFMNLVRKF